MPAPRARGRAPGQRARQPTSADKRSSPWARSSRGRISRSSSRPGGSSETSSGSSSRAAVGRPAGSRPTHGSGGSATSPTRRSPVSTVGLRCSPFLPCSRASGCRSSRPCLRDAGRRVDPSLARRGVRRRRSASTRATPRRSAGIRDAVARREELVRLGLARGRVLLDANRSRDAGGARGSLVSGDRRPEEVAVVVRRPRPTASSSSSCSARRRSWGTGTSSPAASSGASAGHGGRPGAHRGDGACRADTAPRPARLRPLRRSESVRERFPPGPSGSSCGRTSPMRRQQGEADPRTRHVEHRWLTADAAVALLHYPEPREAVRMAAA